MSEDEQIDPAEEAAAEQRDTTGEPSPAAAPAAPSTPGPVGGDAAPGPGSGESDVHGSELGPKLFAAALLVAALIVWLWRR